MKHIISVFNLLSRNQLFPIAKTFLTYLFAVSISSFLYESLYHPYELLDLTDYKGVYSFLVKGEFAIPLSIFLIVWFMTSALAESVFSLSNLYLSNRIKKFLFGLRWISEPNLTMNDGRARNISDQTFSESYGNRWYVILYKHFRNTTSKEQKDQFLQRVRRAKRQTGYDFALIIRAIVAMTIYFCFQLEFGLLLYVLTLTALILYALATVALYQITEHIPRAIIKLESEIAPYLVEGNTDQNTR